MLNQDQYLLIKSHSLSLWVARPWVRQRERTACQGEIQAHWDVISLKNILSKQPQFHKQGKHYSKKNKRLPQVWKPLFEKGNQKLVDGNSDSELNHSRLVQCLACLWLWSGQSCVCSDRHRHTATRLKEGGSYILIETWGGPNWNSIHFSLLTMSCIKPPWAIYFIPINEVREPGLMKRLFYFRLHLSCHKHCFESSNW